MIWFLLGLGVVLFILAVIPSAEDRMRAKQTPPIVTSMSSDDFLDYYLDLMDEKDARKKGKYYDYPDGY
jgi:hypothetical protein